MSTIIPHSLDMTKSVIDNYAFKNIKLLPIFMQTFSINNNQVKCIKCNVSCILETNYLLFHLMTCNGSLIEEEFQITEKKFNCLLCNFTTTNIDNWKHHVLELNHITNIFDSNTTEYSYNCNLCNVHFYGLKDNILKHHCKPKTLSLLSEIMSYIYKSFNIHHNRMLYYCADCLHYTHDISDLHIKNNCKTTKNSRPIICKTCSITFYESSNTDYLNHKISFEHIVLWCLNSERTKLNTAIPLQFNLPLCITKFFIIDYFFQKMFCVVCNVITMFSSEYIYDHFKKCISSKCISTIDECTPLRKIHCYLCHYQYSVPEEDIYKYWVDHVISLEHLSYTIKKTKNVYSYYCCINKTIFYGTEDMIKNEMLHTNEEIESLLFVSKVMSVVYCQLNTHFNYTILFCCGICKYYTNNISENCGHRNINQFYCSTCLVEFNVESDYNNHLISSEHIILKYFKPNQLGELKIIEHLMKTLKICNMIKNDDNLNMYISSKNNNDEKINVPFTNNNFEFKNLLDDSYTISHNILDQGSIESKQNVDSGISISYFIDKLSAQPNKSAFNNYLRMKFELLNQMPHAINGFIKSVSFYCTICHVILCDKFNWTKHDAEVHSDINLYPEFYCAICRIYYIGSSINIDNHVSCMEHNIMIEFQEFTKENSIKPIVNNNNNTVLPVDKDQVLEEKIFNKQDKKNKNIYIEIKDINKSLKENNYYYLKQIINKKYGEFKQMSNKSNCFIILFENMEQVQTFIRDKNELEKDHGFNIEIIGQNKEKVLSMETNNLFSDWRLLSTTIFNQLNRMDEILNNSKNEIRILCDSVCKLNIGSSKLVAYVFGSRVYGLATVNSDVDLYLDIGGTFDGNISNNINKQVDLVKAFANECISKPSIFKNVEEICNARVPIVKFHHIQTKLNCDVSFKSGLSWYNTKLIKLYLSMDKTVKWLACVIVKNWAPQNNLIDKTMFTSYALIWLVLFYLMTKNIVPSLVKLISNIKITDRKIIEGWDCSFNNKFGNKNIKNLNRPKLLLDFFQYYTNKQNLIDNVLCTFTGKCMTKQNFYKQFKTLSEINRIQQANINKFRQKICLVFEKHEGMAVQDPFELSFNITKHINDSKVSDFCELCDQSAIAIKKTKYCNLIENMDNL